MQRSCKQCGSTFEITQDDLAFYDKVSPVFNGKKELIPPPSLCPDCRLQHRFAWRNERHLFRRPCMLCGKSILANYHTNAVPPVYCLDCWWGDQWDALTSGVPLHQPQDFWSQFGMLSGSTPRPALQVLNGQNADFTNFSRDAKDCYLCFSTVHCERCLYVTHTDESRDCMDGEGDEECELCYECSNCINCYHLTHSVRCENCSDASFLYDCKSCQHCYMSANLRDRQYIFRGQQLSPDEYERQLAAEHLETVTGLNRSWHQFENVLHKALHHSLITQSENCSGDILKNCKNCRECFDCFSGEDSIRCYRSPPTFRDCCECYGVYGGSELSMEISNGKNVIRTFAAIQCQNIEECQYCIHCYSSHHLFGCIGMRNKEYCILNKQYTKEKYEMLVPEIIEHMRKTPLRSSLLRPAFAEASAGKQGYEGQAGVTEGQAGEWGAFFPIELSPFAFNETIAQEYFPITEQEAEKRGWQWREEKDEIPKVSKVIPASALPDSIDDIPDDILNWAIECETTKRPFKIIKQELEFYRKMKLPIPHFHPDERHRRRMALRNPRRLWTRPCMKCGKQMETTYAPERPETVYCEECYLKEVY